jgi:hypothetical protein
MKYYVIFLSAIFFIGCSIEDKENGLKAIYHANKIAYEREVEIWSFDQNSHLAEFTLRIEKTRKQPTISIFIGSQVFNLKASSSYKKINDHILSDWTLNDGENIKRLSRFYQESVLDSPSLEELKIIIEAVALIHEPISIQRNISASDSLILTEVTQIDSSIARFDNFSGLLTSYFCCDQLVKDNDRYAVLVEKFTKIGNYWLPIVGVIKTIEENGKINQFRFTIKRTSFKSVANPSLEKNRIISEGTHY